MIIGYIKNLKAVNTLQKWIRKIRFDHRVLWIAKTENYLNSITKTLVYLPTQIYFKLKEIQLKSEK